MSMKFLSVLFPALRHDPIASVLAVFIALVVPTLLTGCNVDRCPSPDKCKCDRGLAGPRCEFIVPEGYVWIPAGRFYMGTPVDESVRLTDEQAHPVTITRSFLMKRSEVTQEEWMALSGGVHPLWRPCGDCPVAGVDWNAAAAFANATSLAEGIEPCYVFPECEGSDMLWQDGGTGRCPGPTFVGHSCDGYRLPTEAEWEYAARAGRGSQTYGGDLRRGDCEDPVADRVAWYCGNSGGQAHPVGARVSPWRLTDMLGNVWEWTNDWYDRYPDAATDPLGPRFGSLRTVRGGGYGDAAHGLRPANRGRNAPGFRAPYVGFRLARWVE